MGLPKAVLEAEARADAIIAQRNQQNGTPAPQAPEAPAAPAAQAPAEAPAPAATNAPAPAAPTHTPAFESTWEQRFKVLDGKYKAEVPRLHNEIKDLKLTVTNLQEQLAAKPAATGQRVEFTEAEREQFGDELLAVVSRVAAAQAPAASAPQVDLAPINEQLQRLQQRTAATDEEKFFDKLKGLVPHYEAQNVDAGFVNWLAESDPLTGRIRQSLFDEAFDQLDVVRIAAFFNAFPYQSTVARSNTAQPTLEQQVAPDVSRANPSAPAGKPTYTRAGIGQFYADVRRGLYQGRLDEMQRIEQDIFAAQQENRVRG